VPPKTIIGPFLTIACQQPLVTEVGQGRIAQLHNIDADLDEGLSLAGQDLGQVFQEVPQGRIAAWVVSIRGRRMVSGIEMGTALPSSDTHAWQPGRSDPERSRRGG
jgi:hypothetical protein